VDRVSVAPHPIVEAPRGAGEVLTVPVLESAKAAAQSVLVASVLERIVNDESSSPGGRHVGRWRPTPSEGAGTSEIPRNRGCSAAA